MLKIAVCDNEMIFCKEMEGIITDYCNARDIDCEISLFQSGEELVSLDENMNQFQIVYLDVNMDGIDGVETAQMLRKWCEDTYLVFVTAYIHYTLEGYKVEAIRYILKNSETLEENVIESLDTILDKMNVNASVETFLFKEGACKLSHDQIVKVESKLHKLYFTIKKHNEVRVYTMAGKLNDMEERFQGMNYVRIHQSILVNMKYVMEISNYEVKMWNDEVLPVSRSRYKDAKIQYLLYKGEA